NRGNNSTKIFFTRDNYLYFLNKIRKYLLPHCDILAYCLMPNHFHFMIYINESGTSPVLNNSIAVLLRSYTQAINKQENRTGSLFQQKSKTKKLHDPSDGYKPSDGYNMLDYPIICFHYIHQNPLKANLVSKMEDWEFSSFKDYVGLRDGKLCNQLLAKELLDLPDNNNELYDLSYGVIEENIFENSALA
ncbi:transposase, partial [Cytophagaceae bacterium AH-315-L13]|nr:transposase [Cytophagaceae bacterium AH-315-L13]